MHRHSILSLGILSAVWVVGVQAQDRTDPVLQNCLAIESDRARLECLDDALGRAEPAPAAIEPPRQTDAVSAQVSQPAPARQVPPQPAADAPAPTQPAAVRPAPAEDRPPAGRARQVRAAEAGRTVRIVEVLRAQVGNTIFVTEDGQTLLQTSTNTGRYPDAPFEAVLDDAARDTFFLISPLGGPRVRVSVQE